MAVEVRRRAPAQRRSRTRLGGSSPSVVGRCAHVVALLIAVALAASTFTQGYYGLGMWAPLELGLLVLLAVMIVVRRPALSKAGWIALCALLALLALSAASMLWADSKEAAWTDTNRLALYCALFYLVAGAVRDRRVARAMILILGAGALAASLWVIFVMLDGHAQGDFLYRRLNAPIGYVNADAGLLVMGVWVWLALAETASRRVVRSAALAAAALIASTVILTQSRAIIPAGVIAGICVLFGTRGTRMRALRLAMVATAVVATLPWTLPVYTAGGVAARASAPPQSTLTAAALAMIVAALVTGIVALAADGLLRREFAPVARRVAWVLVVIAIAAVAVGAVLAAPTVRREYHTFTSLNAAEPTGTRLLDVGGYRYDLWRVAWREFEAHPLGGLGAGNYDAEYYRLRRNPEYVQQPHSLELQMAAELGIGGLLLLLSFCGAVFAGAFRRRVTLSAPERFVQIAATGIFTAWLIATSVDWLYDIPGITGFAIVAAALLLSRPGPSAHTRPRLGAGIAGLVVVALLAASIARQYVGERTERSGAAQIASSPRAAIATLDRAHGLDPYAETTLYSLAAAYARLDDYAAARDTLLLAAAREPDNYVPAALLGDLATRRGDRRTAVAAYERALTLDPHDPSLLAALNAVRAARR